MDTIVISAATVTRTIESIEKVGAVCPEALAMWKQAAAFFANEPAAVSFNGDRDVWVPIIKSTGDAIAQAMAKPVEYIREACRTCSGTGVAYVTTPSYEGPTLCLICKGYGTIDPVARAERDRIASIMNDEAEAAEERRTGWGVM